MCRSSTRDRPTAARRTRAGVLHFFVYSELRRLAANYMRDERAAATLQPTALVHEAYLRLVSQDMPDWESRSHFFGVAAPLQVSGHFLGPWFEKGVPSGPSAGSDPTSSSDS